VVVVKFEMQAQKEARIIPLHTRRRREGGSASQERRTPGLAHEKRRKKEKEGLQIRSSPVDATRRRCPDPAGGPAPR
jgi:hypothetical protein